MFLALLDRMRIEHERQFMGFACLRADVNNSSQFIDHRKRQFAPTDFMPGQRKVRRISLAQFTEAVKAGGLFG